MVLSATSEIRIFTSARPADVGAHRCRRRVRLRRRVAGNARPVPACRRRWHDALGADEWDDAGAPAGGSGTALLIGDFDGLRFTPRGGPRWVDHGASFYAAQSWNDLDDGRRVWIAWMGNWAEHAPPAAGWRMAGPDVRPPRSDAACRRFKVRARAAPGARTRQAGSATLPTSRPSPMTPPNVARPGTPLVAAAGLDASVRVVASRCGADAFITVDRANCELLVEIPQAVAGFGPAEGLVRRVRVPPIDIALCVVLDAASIEVFAGPVTITDALGVDPASGPSPSNPTVFR